MNQPRDSEKWVCAIHRVNLGSSEVPECDWPHCGCDPEATRVLDMALECGWMGPREASDARARLAAAEAQVAALHQRLDHLLKEWLAWNRNLTGLARTRAEASPRRHFRHRTGA